MKPPKYGNNYALRQEEKWIIDRIDRRYTALEDVSQYLDPQPLKVPIFDIMVYKIWENEGMLGQ